MHTTNRTTDYKQFKMLVENRQTARTHINKLKDAIQKNPEIMEVQPILVNEKMEIIDGQHRFVAASELGLPIVYNQVKGLDIGTARDMNIMQRKWGITDYAFSYAKAGNVHYKAFNEFHKEYPGISASLIMIVMGGGEAENMAYDFRHGNFVMKREKDDIIWTLDELNRIKTATNGEIPMSKSFVTSLLRCIDRDDFEYERFITNLLRKPELFHRTSVVRDSLRMIEDIYNYNHSQANQLRLY